MGYSAVPTYVTGDTFTAANANTYWRDNFAAGVPDIFTAAGDIAYATAANAAAPLAKGTAYQFATMNAGATAPTWASLGSILQVGYSTEPNWDHQFSSTSFDDATEGTYSITLLTTSTIITMWSGYLSVSLPSTNVELYLSVNVEDSGSSSYYGNEIHVTAGGSEGSERTPFTCLNVAQSVPAGVTNIVPYGAVVASSMSAYVRNNLVVSLVIPTG